ncbi:MAG TPA: NAD(P)-dependent oxidoreductase [Solirubrobacteraceae bacterium]|jgi:D-3-phosphoglycerate dehydrogenase|nr:NAD(P)-dependent oxidoreductase [Solirubrobacteraceae bacterium]
MPTRYFREAFALLAETHEVRYADADETSPYQPETPSERKLSEFLGSPRSLAAEMDGVEVLAVQGAPVTAEVLAAGGGLRLVACARGGPLNVDVEALSARGLPLVNTPGKNSEAVADLTIAFLVMLARGVPTAVRFLQEGRRVRDNWEGAQFMGSDLRDHTLGLVGYGQVGQRVAQRAQGFGLGVLVYDPFVQADGPEQVQRLDELLHRSDFVSLHARATPATEKLIDAAAIAAMKPGAVLVNTARESLVDEDALHAALSSGHLGGAGLDVFDSPPAGERSRLLGHENVVLTPHIGGATRETLKQGAEMLAAEIARFGAGEPLAHLVETVGVNA